MKKVLFIFIALVAFASCFKESSYTQSGTIVATFEFNGSNFSDVFRKDSIYFDTQYKVGIGWTPLAFYHNINKETSEFEGGFILSCLSIPSSGLKEGLINNEYRVNTKDTLVFNSFLVFCQTDNMPEHDMGFTYESSAQSQNVCVMSECYVNNTVAVAEAVKEQFVAGDKLLLKAKGYLAGKETATAEVVLAEKTTAKDSIVSNWTKFDLSKLGSIDKVDFEFELPEGKNIPLTVCIDNVIANVTINY